VAKNTHTQKEKRKTDASHSADVVKTQETDVCHDATQLRIRSRRKEKKKDGKKYGPQPVKQNRSSEPCADH
jgi:hypothetical protein